MQPGFRPILRSLLLAWPLVIFLAGFAALIALITHQYLVPAGTAVIGATPPQKRLLSAYSALLLSIVLLIIITGLVMVYRHRRSVRGVLNPPVERETKVVDAWAESGRRIK
jgi:uncharacterized membrane protein YedE/YeeE